MGELRGTEGRAVVETGKEIMAGRSGSLKRWILPVVLGILLAKGLFEAGVSVVGWTNQRKATAGTEMFLEEVRRTIPEGARVYLCAAHGGLQAANALYPRPVHLCRPEEAGGLRVSSPDAWVVFLTAPFDRARCFVGKARDFP